MTYDVAIAPEVESFACAFERARAECPSVAVDDFLPPRTHPRYADIGLELLRIDLELTWLQPNRPTLDEYRRRFSEILDSRARLERLAFEEYRQRCDAGQAIAPSEYAVRYGVDVSAWPSSTTARGEACPQKCTDQDVLAIGSRFAEFELVEELGQGAFARVFLARQLSLANRLVALKISRGYSVEPDRLAQLQHANIVPIYSVQQSGELQGICMPYVGRHTLAHVIEHIRTSGRLPPSGKDLLTTIIARNDSTMAPALPPFDKPSAPPRRASIAASICEHFARASFTDAVVWIFARLADGLAHAHERGVLHRDLKPANVLFSDDGRPMILDFNLSGDMTRGAAKETVAGGTLPYMSPEQLESLATGAAVDVRTDIYALGVMFFELLTGRLPFEPPAVASPSSLAAAVAARRYGANSVRELNPHVPQSIAAVVARCLAPDADKRYQSANQLREDLNRHLEHRPLANAPEPSRERARKWVRRHPRLASGASMGLVASIAIVAMAAVWLGREAHFGRVEATRRFHDFSSQVVEAKLPLSLPGVDADAHGEGTQLAKELLETYRVLDGDEWRGASAYMDLAPAQRRQLDRDILGLLHSLAASSMKRSAADSETARRQSLLDESASYNSTALQLAAAAAPDLRTAFISQRRLIQQSRAGHNPPSAKELIEDATALAGPRRAALQLLQQRRYSEALPRLFEWRDHEPTNMAAWMLLGVAHAGMGNTVEAEECFTTCTRLRPQFAFSYFQRGLSRHQQRKYTAAAEDFGRYMKRRGISAAALINRALSYEALGNFDQALRDLNAALAAGARQTRIYFIRAGVRKQLNDLEGAKQDFEQGLALTPSDPISWLARGMARLGKSPELALADFRQALQLDPGNRMAAQNVLHVLTDRLHRNDEALVLLDQLIDANPRDAQALLTRAVLHARRSEADQAVADAMSALQIDASPLSSLHAACAFAQISRNSDAHRGKALQLLSEALGAQPTLAAMAVTDPDLEPLRGSEEFERILTAADVLRDGGATSKEATAAR
ncbi:MAG TPA: protein kinase [Lacipirellula sp.]